jgi:hypothetical protein
MKEYKKVDGIVSWAPDWPEVEVEFDIEGRVRCVGSVLPGWLIEELEQNEAESRHERSLGDAWSGGFAENH